MAFIQEWWQPYPDREKIESVATLNVWVYDFKIFLYLSSCFRFIAKIPFHAHHRNKNSKISTFLRCSYGGARASFPLKIVRTASQRRAIFNGDIEIPKPKRFSVPCMCVSVSCMLHVHIVCVFSYVRFIFPFQLLDIRRNYFKRTKTPKK